MSGGGRNEAETTLEIKIEKALDEKTASIQHTGGFGGGPERIRTAVQAFAELCLATRPQDLLK